MGLKFGSLRNAYVVLAIGILCVPRYDVSVE